MNPADPNNNQQPQAPVSNAQATPQPAAPTSAPAAPPQAPAASMQSPQQSQTAPMGIPSDTIETPAPSPMQTASIQQPTNAVPQQNFAQPANPQPAVASPPPPTRKLPLKIIIIIAVVFLLVFIAVIAMSILTGGNSAPAEQQVYSPESTPLAGPAEHTVEEYPDYNGIEVDENTVSFNKVDESFRINYLGKIYHEQDTESYGPREVFPETADDYTWYGLVDTPDDVIGTPELFSFKAPPTYRSFIFIMRWDRSDGEKYEMYRFHDNQVTKLTDFTKDRAFYVPILDNFSLGGNFVSINIFSCPTCTYEEPEILLYHIPSGETRNIGRVSYFSWGDDDNAYEYREYKEGVDPANVPIRKNEFFVESTTILNP